MSKDHHGEPYDEGTLCKLNLYREYLHSSIPVFLSEGGPNVDLVNVFDFFAGPGQDMNGSPGSPLIAVEELSVYANLIAQGNRKVTLFLNEKNKRKWKN